MAKTVVSERVISTKVIKKEIPIIGGLSRKFEKVGASIKGFFTAFILLFVAFIVIVSSEKFERKSIVVEGLELEQSTELKADSGMHKIQGVPTVSTPLSAPEIGPVLYYDLTVEEYKQVEKKETETVTKMVEGQQVEQVIEKTIMEDEWVEAVSEAGKWATFTLGKYSINPESASKKLNYQTNEYWLDKEWDEYELLSKGTTRTPVLGDQRMTINYLNLDTKMILVGEITESDGKKIFKSGEPFIITTKSDSELTKSMQDSENASFWMLKLLAFVLLVAGFKGVIGPILALLDFIPVVGKAANGVATVIAVILSIIIIAIVSFVVRYLWLFILIPVLIIGFLLYKQFSKPERDEGKKPSEE